MPLDDTNMRHLMELFFFGYRSFTKEADLKLSEFNLGRAHHRTLFFISKNPGIPVSDLLKILEITKQSLARVLKDLMTLDYVTQIEGRKDRRQRCLHLTRKGHILEQELFARQSKLLTPILDEIGPEGIATFEKVMQDLVDREKNYPPYSKN